MKTLLTCLALSFCTFSFAQNIAPNPDFEKYSGLIPGFSQSPTEFDNCIKSWRVPNKTTPDYSAPFFRNHDALFGETHSGFCMLGLDVVSQWSECVYAKLSEDMEPNTTYQLEFWIKRSQTDFQGDLNATPSECPPAFVSPDFGLLLSDTLQSVRYKEFVVGTPQLRCGPKCWVDKKWLKISGYFTADKAFRYVYLGQFRPEGQTGPLPSSGYVFIDDVVIRKVSLSDPSAGEALKTPGAIIPLDQVYFQTDKSDIEERSFASLDTLANMLRSAGVQVRINGHTDNQGSVAHNQRLSEERAKAVYNYLITKGLDKKRLSWQGFGDTKPKADNTSETGRQKNRRVEFEVLGE